MELTLPALCGDTGETLVAIMTHPLSKADAKPDVLNKIAIQVIRERVVLAVGEVFGSELQECLDEYVMLYGPVPPDGAEAGEWELGLDKEVDQRLSPYINVLSSEWLAENTTGRELHAESAVARYACSVGEGVYSFLTDKKKPGQIVAAAGLTPDRIQAAIAARDGITAAGSSLGDDYPGLDEALSAIWAHQQATDWREAADIAGQLKLACEGGGLEALLPDHDPVEAAEFQESLEGFGALNGDDATLLLMTRLQELSEAPESTAEPVVAAVPGTRRRTSKAGSAKPVLEGTVDPRALALLKDHGNVNDNVMGAELGVSRATFNNYVNGKTAFVPSAEQRTIVRNIVWAHLQGLAEAMSLLDGVTYEAKVAE